MIVVTRPALKFFKSLLREEFATIGTSVFADRIRRSDPPSIFELFMNNVAAWGGASDNSIFIPLQSKEGVRVESRFFKSLGCDCKFTRSIRKQNVRSRVNILGQPVSELLGSASGAIRDSTTYDHKAEEDGGKCLDKLGNTLERSDESASDLSDIESLLYSQLEKAAKLSVSETLNRKDNNRFDRLFGDM